MFLSFSTLPDPFPSVSTCGKRKKTRLYLRGLCFLHFFQKQYLCVNIPNCYLIPAVLLAPCVRGAFLSQLSLYSGGNLFFSTWQAVQKKIGKGDECICCTVFPDIWGRGGELLALSFMLCLHVIQLKDQWECGSQQRANVSLFYHAYCV